LAILSFLIERAAAQYHRKRTIESRSRSYRDLNFQLRRIKIMLDKNTHITGHQAVISTANFIQI
jgi:hypothetical protein